MAHLGARNGGATVGSSSGCGRAPCGCPASAARTSSTRRSKPAPSPAHQADALFPQPRTRPAPARRRPAARRCRRRRAHTDALLRRGRRSAEPLGPVAVPGPRCTGAGPYYQGRRSLVAADCTAFACASFHERFMSGNVTHHRLPQAGRGLLHTDKLAAIIAANDITSVTVARMEVPCCGGPSAPPPRPGAQSGKDIFEVITFAVNGDVID